MNLLQINLQDFDPDIAREFGGGASTMDFLGVPLFDAQSLWTTLIRFVFNILVCWVIIHFFYYKKANRKDYYFTFIMFAAVIFLIISLMENMKMNIAYALGLFAIFGMIRYRTETIKIREMTYLFVVMGLSIVNGMALSTSYIELLAVNLMVVLIIWMLDGTGLDISKVEVGHIDYLRDVAFVKVYYKPIDGEVNTIDTITKLKDFDV